MPQELTQHKRHRDEFGVVVTVNRKLLKKSPLIIFKNKPGKKNMGKKMILSNLSDLLQGCSSVKVSLYRPLESYPGYCTLKIIRLKLSIKLC